LAVGVAAACSETPAPPSKYGPRAGAATPTPSAGGHDVGAPVAADRPKASGQLQSVHDATLPPLDPARDRALTIEATDGVAEVAAGVKLNAWTFDGAVPGKVVHLRQGDSLDFTLRNKGAMGHSIDFHAAQVPWDINYKTILPNEEINFRWTANFPGVFMYHCGTGPVLEHIGNGMYGAVVVDPAQGFAPAREYVLVQSEFYLKKAANGASWDGDLQRMAAVQPDFVTFNGAANQYQQQPLAATPGELIRLYVMNAGPTLFSAFHVIGALFDNVYADGNPANVMHGIQTWTIPPGGGATFELRIPDAGKYPFVTHSFAYTGLGAVGLLDVK
jgi:nitrite reductase (NO-forming)